MKNVFKSPKTYMVAGLVIIVFTASAWQLKNKKQHNDTAATNNYADADTTKPRKHGFDKIDDGIGDTACDGNDITIDLSGLDTTIAQTVREALATMDVNAIVHDALREVHNIDWKEINHEIHQSLREAQHEIDEVDMEEINREIREAQDEIRREGVIDSVKIQAIIKDALRNVKVTVNGQRRI